MVIDRNDRNDYDEIVEIMIIGEIKSHFKNEFSDGSNLKQV